MIEEVDLDGPRSGEVLVEITSTGVCHTDEFTRSGGDPEGLFPMIFGHEGAGVVREVGPGVITLQPGDHVIALVLLGRLGAARAEEDVDVPGLDASADHVTGGASPPPTPSKSAASNPNGAPDDVAGPPLGTKRTAGGVWYRVLVPGRGTRTPTAAQSVKVHYTGWTTDGKQFDSSVSRGIPAIFPLSAVIPSWTDGLQVMTVGMKARLWIPQDLAYKGQPGRPAGMLVFDVELLEIQ